MSTITKAFAGLCAIVALGGCMERDPYRRTDVWRPTGANSANIAAMAANPKDLIRGSGTTRSHSAAHIKSIERVQEDRAKPLLGPAGSSSGGQSGGGGGGQGGGSGGSGGSSGSGGS